MVRQLRGTGPHAITGAITGAGDTRLVPGTHHRGPQRRPDLLAVGTRTHNGPSRSRVLFRLPWPLLLILAGQALLTIRLMPRNTAFQDEALYLWAGHLEIAHWLHGAPIPAFPAYFSGAPVLYPPLGAVVDGLGGLLAARALSLCFMLGACSLLWASTSRLFGRHAAFFGCALWAFLGPTLRLGAFATFDAPSLFMLALAAWCAVRAGPHLKTGGWVAAAAAALALANAIKYASALFDPIVAGLVVLSSLPTLGRRRAIGRGATLMAYAGGTLLLSFVFGGGEYPTGIQQTTLTRAMSTDPVSTVFVQAWHWSQPILIIAAASVAVAIVLERPLSRRLLIILLASAAALVPLEQARIHTATSLDKHVAFGAWFAAIAAGYAVAALINRTKEHAWRHAVVAACALVLFFPVHAGTVQAASLFQSWPNSAALIAELRTLLPHLRGPVLAEHPSLPEYYLPQGSVWERWSSTRNIRLPDGRSINTAVGGSISAMSYLTRLRAGYFSAVILDFGPTGGLDLRLRRTLQQDRHYHLAADIAYGSRGSEVWVYAPQSHFASWRPASGIGRESPLRALLTPTPRPGRVLGPVVLAVNVTAIAALTIVLAIRYTWRRRKGANQA